MKRTLLFGTLLVGIFGIASAQIIDVGPDISVCAGPVNLTATIDSSSIAGTTPPNTVTLSDDEFSGVVNIGFPFTFYGNTYTQCVISSNNFITFDLSVANQYSAWTIVNPCPNPNPGGGFPPSPLNAIMGPWQDILPPSGGSISYQTLGSAPNRVFVVEYCNIPMFSCTGLIFSSQILIRETSNEIETHIITKPLCTTWNSGQAIHGLHNFDGTIAHIVPGRNAPTQWTASNEGYLFTPVNPTTYNISPIPFQPVLLGSPTPPIVLWYEAGNPTPIDTGLTTTVNPPTTTTYVATITGSGCSGLSASDTMILFIGSAVPVIQGINNVCGSDSVELSTTQPYLSYLWSTGDTTATIWVQSGAYSVYVTGPGGCDSTSAIFNVTANASVNGILGLTNPYCIGDPIILDVSGTTPLASVVAFHYDLDNNGTYEVTTTSTTYNATSAFPIAGNYTINMVAEGVGGCNDSLTAVVQIFNNPVVNASVVDPTVCPYDLANFQGSGFIFNAPGQSSTVANYSWDLDFNGTPDTSGATLTDVSEFFTGLGPHSVILTVTSTAGCQTSDTVTVTYVDSPEGNIVAPAVCGNVAASFSFNSTGVPVTTYAWNFGDPTTTSDVSSNPAPSWTYSSPGFYTVVVIVGSTDGCLDTMSTLLNLNPLPSGVISNTAVCAGVDEIFNFNQTSSDIIVNYAWTFPGGNPGSSTDSVETVTFASAGPINVTVIVTNQYGCVDTISAPFLVRNLPNATFGVYPICISRFTFDPFSTNPNALLDWNLGDGTIINDQDTSLFNYIYMEPGDYTATLSITDEFGCTSTNDTLVHVDDSLFILMPNVLVQSSSINNNMVDMDEVSSGFNLCIDYTYTVFDRWGVKVFETHNDPYNPDLNCASCFMGKTQSGALLVPGVYYYVIEGNFNILESGSITIFE